MPSLSSLLVQREVASMRTVEEAIARQVLHGGDLPTNLLELAALREEDLVQNLAESFRMSAAPAGPLPAPDPAVLRVVPAEVAFRHGIFPLEREGNTLVIATSEPLSQAVEEDLSFSLNVSLSQLIAPLVRIRQAIAACYGIPLDRRMMRLVAKLEGRPDPSPTVAPPPPGRDTAGPPPSQMPRIISVPPPKFGTGLPPPDNDPESGVPSSSVVSELPPIPPVPGMPRLRPFEPAPEPHASAPLGVDGMGEPGGAGYARVEPPRTMRARGSDPAMERVPREAGEITPPAQPASAPPPSGRPLGGSRELNAKRGLASWLRRTVLEEKGRAAHEAQERAGVRPRRKGPFTAAMAEQELESAVTTDEVLTVYFAFARQFFTFSFLFVVHGDMAEGHLAWGPGAAQLDPSSIGVPLSLPSSFSLARKRRAPVVARLSSEGIDAEFGRDLGRPPGSGDARAAAAVIPVVVRNRVVALLYGDDGEMPVELSAVGEVIAMTALTAGALERLILRRKLSAFRAEGTPAPTEPAPVAEEVPPPALTPEAAEALADQPPPPSVNRRGPPSIRGPASLPPEIEVGWSVFPPPDDVPQARDTIPAGSMPGDVMWSEGDTYAGMGPDIELPHGLLRSSSGPSSVRMQDGDWVDVGAEAELIEEEEEEPPWFAGDAPTEEAPAMPKAAAGAALPGLVRRPLADRPIPREEPQDEAREPAGEHAEHGESPTERWPRSAPENASEVGPAAPPTVAIGRIQLAERSADAPPDAPAEPSGSYRRDSSPSFPPDEGSGLRALRRRLTPFLGSRGDTSGRRLSEPTPPPPNVQAEFQPILARVLAKAPDADKAFITLVEAGEQVMPLLMVEFPGPITVERPRARDVLPPASRCGPLLELIVAMGRSALASLVSRSTSGNVDVRFWATYALGELPFPEAASAVLPRLFDDDPSIRRVARRSARALVSAGDVGAAIVQGVGHVARNIDEPTRRRVFAIDSMGEIRAGVVVSALISALGDPTEDVSDAARRALFVITRQDFGVDARAWANWWRESAGRHRIEWLIDALVHELPVVRRAAADELMEETGEYYGYAEDLTPDERSRVQGYYREWWEKEGKARFGAGDGA
jgi:hypothetical protein